MTRNLLVVAALAGFAAAALAACGGDDDDDTPAGTATAGASITPSVQPTPSLAQVIARNPQYFLYIVAKGDTLATIADTFDGQAGPPPADFAEKLKALNQLGGEPAEGQPIAIPLRLPGTLSLIPDVSIEAALGVGGGSGKLVLLQPSLGLRDAYENRIVLHTVLIRGGKDGGYLMEYYLADRPPFKGGGADPEAKVVERLFTVGGGSMASAVPATPPGSAHTSSRDGVPYAVQVGSAASDGAAAIAAQLQTAAER